MKIVDYRGGHIEPRDAYCKAVELAITECVLFRAGPQNPRSWWKIGNGLDRLEPAEREAVKNLTSKDAMSICWPG